VDISITLDPPLPNAGIVTEIKTGSRPSISIPISLHIIIRLRLKYDGTRAETRFRLSAKRTSPFKSGEGVSSVDYWQPRCVHQR